MIKDFYVGNEIGLHLHTIKHEQCFLEICNAADLLAFVRLRTKCFIFIILSVVTESWDVGIIS